MEALNTSALEVSAADRPAEHTTAWRWLILGCAWGALLLTFVDRLAWSSVAITVGHTLAIPLAALGVFVTAFYIGYVLSNVAGGIATDVLGPRRTLALALLPLGLCTFLFGRVASVPAGMLLQVLMGLAAGCDYAACIKLVTAWFDRASRGRATGLLMTATSLAVVLANAIIPRLLEIESWTRLYAQLGIVTSLFGVCCFAIVRDGTPPDREPVKPRASFRLLANRDILLLTLAGFCSMWGTWGFAFWANALMVKGYGLSSVAAGAIIMLFGIGAIVSKPLIGLWSDWLGGKRKLLVMLCLAGFAVCLLMFGRLHGAAQFRLLAPLLGVTAFAYSPLMAVLIAEVAGPAVAGSASGLTNAFWQLGSVIVPLVIGMVFQSTHSFFAAFCALAAGPALAVLCMLPVREIRR